MDVVDRLFAEFELVFHNQYNKAFPTPEKLHYAKKLWFDYLRDYQPGVITAAARQAIRESEFLPSIATLLKYCTGAGTSDLPDTYSAYREACLAPSPKADFQWSHPAVYYAGKAAGWNLLASQPENRALPVFTRRYREICERLARGENFAAPTANRLTQKPAAPLGRTENRKKMQQLRRDTGI